ncbi:lactococcin 972 family bacteriocin [Streptomyces sp. CYG20]|nr:lactococcin 972 family bacteriocin [Streptomyces sp. COG21]MBT3082904.1 lactococcin 972 family bacteriocin [Streptomyces sp. COG20]MBT3090023.1 lactococcin 972 family bacteriocin [Streptomyces sp. CYG21]MBT3095421.1 lactococcin 972 family bacteriocin [Streptomyces sp. CBG30]MBT3105097.1 lactococcin 972 family bacteriocin [Streptomyces sp. COG19]MBT3110368.1 lactococcin 972 family bacteriocin [Streptomyces sp. CYG20]
MGSMLSALSLAVPAAASDGQAATVTADRVIVAPDGVEVGRITTHKRGDGTKAPAELGNPSEWGVVAMKMDDSSGTVRPMSEACVNASGGKWCYGWYGVSNGKHCYSNYYHYTKYHDSSVKIGKGSLKAAAKPNQTSQASLEAGLAYTCYTYYGVA